MARPLKYGEKTSVRSVTMPDSMWANLPEPKSQWVVEAVRQMQEVKPYVVIDGKCQHSTTVQVTKGLKCVRCGEFV